jgi:hypothetical protein
VNVTTGNTASSTALSNLASMVGVVIGATVTGAGIPANTTVTAIDPILPKVTLSQAATATATGVTVTFTIDVPKASITREHQSRLWTNDKERPDRIHYSETNNSEVIGGLGDSGAIDVGVGDGDPTGISAIFPSFQGVLYVAKSTKLYRIEGYGDDTSPYTVTLVSEGIGCVSHNSCAAVEDTDLVWVSSRGIHSVIATNKSTSFDAQFLSRDIQKRFNEKFVKSRLKYTSAVYVNNLNCIFFSVTDSRYGSLSNNAIYVYNVPNAAWAEWPRISAQTMFGASDTDGRRFYIGTSTGRLARAEGETLHDISESGTPPLSS